MNKSKAKHGIAIIPLLIIIGVVVFGALTIPKAIKKYLTKSLSSPLAKGKTSAPDASGWQTFHSDQYGYSVKHPQDWIVNDANFAKKQEIWVTDTNKNAFVKINAYLDKTITSPEAVKNAIIAFRNKMSSESTINVTQFKDTSEGNVGGFIAKGEQTIDNEKFLFESRGLLATNGRILIFHGAVKASESQQYGDTISQIITSFSLDKN